MTESCSSCSSSAAVSFGTKQQSAAVAVALGWLRSTHPAPRPRLRALSMPRIVCANCSRTSIAGTDRMRMTEGCASCSSSATISFGAKPTPAVTAPQRLKRDVDESCASYSSNAEVMLVNEHGRSRLGFDGARHHVNRIPRPRLMLSQLILMRIVPEMMLDQQKTPDAEMRNLNKLSKLQKTRVCDRARRVRSVMARRWIHRDLRVERRTRHEKGPSATSGRAARANLAPGVLVALAEAVQLRVALPQRHVAVPLGLHLERLMVVLREVAVLHADGQVRCAGAGCSSCMMSRRGLAVLRSDRRRAKHDALANRGALGTRPRNQKWANIA